MEQVSIVEVAPRDGLQNERKFIETKDKIQFISMLADAGLTRIEATSFVNPRWIPQLSDADIVAGQLPSSQTIQYSALVPNAKGLERARAARISEVAVFVSASETHNMKNLNRSIDETIAIIRDVASEALSVGIKARGYVSTVFGCPFENDVSVAAAVRVTEHLFNMGVHEVSLGDTIGVATPRQVKEKLTVFSKYFPTERLAGHFHDTRGTGLANVYAALECGIKKFDSSAGGIGGCPYAPGASGNIATEELVYLLEGMGIRTGVDLDRLLDAVDFIQEKIDRPLPSKLLSCERAARRNRRGRPDTDGN